VSVFTHQNTRDIYSITHKYIHTCINKDDRKSLAIPSCDGLVEKQYIYISHSKHICCIEVNEVMYIVYMYKCIITIIIIIVTAGMITTRDRAERFRQDVYD